MLQVSPARPPRPGLKNISENSCFPDGFGRSVEHCGLLVDPNEMEPSYPGTNLALAFIALRNNCKHVLHSLEPIIILQLNPSFPLGPNWRNKSALKKFKWVQGVNRIITPTVREQADTQTAAAHEYTACGGILHVNS